MRNPALKTFLLGLGLTAFAGTAQATEIFVSSDITVSETWTANNTYNLQTQIYVTNGATLTIEAGTLVQSDTNVGGSLAVCTGCQIFVQGTRTQPVIMTSKADTMTAWHEGCNEWGNLTIMGEAYISENAIAGNTATPSASNVADMEGLTPAFAGDPKVRYGGGDDDDDSGSVTYCSLRYGGKVVSLTVELNGLSLGGIGRGTDIHHVEIMNNVDDGVEVWGGTVNFRNISIWNIGDDSFDIDQGWRGKAQYILIVQGYSKDASQGGGVCDNVFETDGAEDSDYQPVTTGTIYNATVIGQPLVTGADCTDWRDSCRLQYRNSIFMDLGDDLVNFTNVDGNGAHGYGFNGTLTWANTWTTDYTVTSTINAPGNPGDFYKAQSNGKLIDIKDCVFFRNLFASAYTEADARGVRDAANNNVTVGSSLDVDGPVKTVTRGSLVTKGGKSLLPVTFLDPRPQNDALTSVDVATPTDSFFDSFRFRGAFAPDLNWLCGWTASEAYGMTGTENCGWTDLGHALQGTDGDPLLTGVGDLTPGSSEDINLTNAKANAPLVFVLGSTEADTPYRGGTLVPSQDLLIFGLNADGNGDFSFAADVENDVPVGTEVYIQYLVADNAAPKNIALSNALLATVQ